MKKSELRQLIKEELVKEKIHPLRHILREETIEEVATKFLKKFLQVQGLSDVTMSNNGKETIISFTCKGLDYEIKDYNLSKIKSVYMHQPGSFEITTLNKLF